LSSSIHFSFHTNKQQVAELEKQKTSSSASAVPAGAGLTYDELVELFAEVAKRSELTNTLSVGEVFSSRFLF
jgi:hypothetical protein